MYFVWMNTGRGRTVKLISYDVKRECVKCVGGK